MDDFSRRTVVWEGIACCLFLFVQLMISRQPNFYCARWYLSYLQCVFSHFGTFAAGHPNASSKKRQGDGIRASQRPIWPRLFQ